MRKDDACVFRGGIMELDAPRIRVLLKIPICKTRRTSIIKRCVDALKQKSAWMQKRAGKARGRRFHAGTDCAVRQVLLLFS